MFVAQANDTVLLNY